MGARILNSARAVEVSLFCIREFVALRRAISEHFFQPSSLQAIGAAAIAVLHSK
jgi:hypothetical protein